MNPRKDQQKLFERLPQTGVVIPGTVRKISLRCGKANCRCQSSDLTQRHGPYFFWDRKVNGRLSSKSISPEQAKFIQRGIKNRRHFEKLVQKILILGEGTASNFKND